MEIKNIDEVKTKLEAREIAMEFQHEFESRNYDYEEIAKWGAYLEALAKKFGLEDEFKENGIFYKGVKMTPRKRDKMSQELVSKAYLLQMNIEYTPKNVEEYGLDGNTEYVATAGNLDISTHKNEYGNWLNIVNKDTLEMTSLEF